MERIILNPLSFVDDAGTEFFIGDVISYPNPSIKEIVCFGWYDNGDCYEDQERGCGFYLKRYQFDDVNWHNPEGYTSVTGINKTYSFDKETNPVIVAQIRECFNRNE